MGRKVGIALTALMAILGSMVIGNLPSCEGGGALLVDGEWVTYTELADASMHWPRTKAVVTESYLKVSSSSKRKSISTKRPKIEYEYRVDGRLFKGRHVKFRAPSSKEARAWVKAYPEGVEITVSYDPEHPQNSVIAPGP